MSLLCVCFICLESFPAGIVFSCDDSLGLGVLVPAAPVDGEAESAIRDALGDGFGGDAEELGSIGFLETFVDGCPAGKDCFAAFPELSSSCCLGEDPGKLGCVAFFEGGFEDYCAGWPASLPS